MGTSSILYIDVTAFIELSHLALSDNVSKLLLIGASFLPQIAHVSLILIFVSIWHFGISLYI